MNALVGEGLNRMISLCKALGSRGYQCLALAIVTIVSTSIASAQNTNIAIGSSVIQPSVKRFGINLGATNYYDSSQMMKNLVFRNPGFEGEIYQSIIRCASGTLTTCTDDDPWEGWPTGFWNGATVQFFYGTAQGRTGTVTSYTAASGAIGGIFTFSTAGVVPSTGDQMFVRMTLPGNASNGWWTSKWGAGAITTNFS